MPLVEQTTQVQGQSLALWNSQDGKTKVWGGGKELFGSRKQKPSSDFKSLSIIPLVLMTSLLNAPWRQIAMACILPRNSYKDLAIRHFGVANAELISFVNIPQDRLIRLKQDLWCLQCVSCRVLLSFFFKLWGILHKIHPKQDKLKQGPLNMFYFLFTLSLLLLCNRVLSKKFYNDDFG